MPAYAADAGKDGHRGDAVALLIGFGEAVGRGEDGDALISSGVRRFLVHMKLEGAGDGDWGLNEQWARRAADYLSAPASARSAIDRPHPVGWNEV
ncbi:hypothetical protein GS579_27225 [Rhodococcus hoagii]|nr:hypothetical protein [Prescottella equi]